MKYSQFDEDVDGHVDEISRSVKVAIVTLAILLSFGVIMKITGLWIPFINLIF